MIVEDIVRSENAGVAIASAINNKHREREDHRLERQDPSPKGRATPTERVCSQRS